MFGKKKYFIEPVESANDVLIQISAPQKINKKTKLTVPQHYKAIAYVDQKATFRVEPCVAKEILDVYGKEYKDKQLRVAFIANRTLAQSAWGFGNIQVNNEALKEAYRIGANGSFCVEVTDYEKLIALFPNENIITAEMVREKCISTLKTVGVPIIGEYFAKTQTSVFEMSTLVTDFRDKFLKALATEKIFGTMGIKITVLTVNGFYANEDDLEVIRNRINA